MNEDIQIIDVEQGTHEWHQARAGVITASMMGEVLKVAGGLNDQQQAFVDAVLAGAEKKEAAKQAGYKAVPTAAGIQKALDGEEVGDFSETAKAYAFRLAIERISGEPLDEGVETYWMKRGHELEPEARAEHSMRLGQEVVPAGFIRTSDGKFGCSADGFIGDLGGAEYKCFVDPMKLKTVILGHDFSEFVAQCQAGLWLSGRQWWDFGLYCPALEAAGRQLTMKRMPRDEDFIDAMEQRALKFDALVEEYRAALLAEEGEAPRAEPEPEPSAEGIFGGGA